MLERSRSIKCIGIGATLLLHLVFLIAFMLPTVRQPPKPPPRSLAGDDPKVVFLSPIHPLPYSRYQELANAAVGAQEKDCPKSYVGIGVRWWPSTGTLISIAPNSPASNVGFQVGDRIIDQERFEGDFSEKDIGKILTIRVVRDNKETTVTLRLAKICYEEQVSHPIDGDD